MNSTTTTHGNMSSEARNLTSSPTVLTIITSLFVIHFFVSLIGNSLVIAVVYKNVNKKMRTTMNLFVVNMAASDLLMTILSLPLQFAFLAFGSETLSLYLSQSAADLIICKIHPAIWFASSGVSILSHVAISLDRFWAVFFPTKRHLTSRTPNFVVIAIWFFCSCFAIIPTFASDIFCSRPSGLSSFLYLYFVFYLAMPTIAILLVYPAILIKLWNRKIPGNPSVANQDLRDRTNFRITKMAVALVTSFAVSFFPYLVTVINNTVTKITHVNNRAIPDKEETIGFATVAVVLTYSSCMWNPLILVIFNANFRTGFKTILQTLCHGFSLRVNNCYKKKESSTISSIAIDLGQEMSNIRVTSMKNLHEN